MVETDIFGEGALTYFIACIDYLPVAMFSLLDLGKALDKLTS